MKISKLRLGHHPWVRESLSQADPSWKGFGELPSLDALSVVGQRLHSTLPCKWQFKPVVYIAYNAQQLMGIICLSPDGSTRNRWVIQGLAIHPGESSLEVGENLVNYVVHQYGADGIQTFRAAVSSHQEAILGIFKSSGFRFGCRMHYYQQQIQSAAFSSLTENPVILHATQRSQMVWRQAMARDIPELVGLHRDRLPPEIRVSLEKVPGDFSFTPIKRVQEKLEGSWFRRWVLEDVEHQQLAASVSFYSKNYRDYKLEIMISPAWQDASPEIVDLALQQVFKSTSSAHVTLGVFEFEKSLLDALGQKGFEHFSSEEILVKDYWIPVSRLARPLSNPLEIFTGKTSPACSKI